MRLPDEAAAPDGAAEGRRFGSLDALRGIAALAIVVYHLDDRLGWPFWFDNFYLGVDLFFALSGFIIYAVYGDAIRDGQAYGRFLWLRLARIYPLHLATLLAFIVLQTAVTARGGSLEAMLRPIFSHNDVWSLLANLFAVHGLHLFEGPSFNIPSWSISTELYTYVFFGALFWVGAIGRDRPFLVPGLLAVVAYAWLAAKTSSIHVMHDWGLVRNVLGFALGIVAYGVCTRLPAPSTRVLSWTQAGAIAALLLMLAISTRRVPYVDYAAPIAFAVLIAACSHDRGGLCPLLLRTPLQWLGRISYSVYMTHYIIVLLASAAFLDAVRDGLLDGTRWMSLGFLLLVVAIVLVVSHVSYEFLERPARTLLRGLWPRRAARLAA
jgi:peptidoglycan/LPS O-acetylase OafA/YrhL